MWGVHWQIRHITAAQTISGLTLRSLNVGLLRSQPFLPLPPTLLNHTKPRGGLCHGTQSSKECQRIFLPSRTFGDPLLLGRGDGMELLNCHVTGDK